MSRFTTDTNDVTPTRRKATLFCWECDHESPIDGDWKVHPRYGAIAYVCPDCETTLATRSRPIEPVRPQSIAGPLAAWQRTLRATTTVWRASLTAGFSSLTALTEFATAGSRPRSDK